MTRQALKVSFFALIVLSGLAAGRSQSLTQCPYRAVPVSSSCSNKNGVLAEFNKCYFINHNFTGTWQASESLCNSMGANLASILSEESQAVVAEYWARETPGERVWFGYNDIRNESIFVWVDGSNDTNFTVWGPGEPNNVGNEDCAVLRNPNAEWNDEPCTRDFASLCSRIDNITSCECPDGTLALPTARTISRPCFEITDCHECLQAQDNRVGYAGEDCVPVDPSQGNGNSCEPRSFVNDQGLSETNDPTCVAGACLDVDECTSPSTHTCNGTMEVCINTDGSFQCGCVPGFNYTMTLGCQDIDECASGTDNCDSDATCSNTEGSFTCDCNLGYIGTGVTCQDLNECVVTPFVLDVTGNGINNPLNVVDGIINNNLWQTTGASGDASTCADVDYLTIDLAEPTALASVTVYHYHLDVRQYCNQALALSNSSAFTGEETVVFTCSDYADCGDTTAEGRMTSFDPPLTARFIRVSSSRNVHNTGIHILEVVPIAAQRHDCDVNAACNNTDGSFTCACNAGYTDWSPAQDGVDGACELNQCEVGVHNCDGNATCVDTDGSFLCECNSGYENRACRARCPSYEFAEDMFQGSASYSLITDCPLCQSTRALELGGPADPGYVVLGSSRFGGDYSLSMWLFMDSYSNHARIFDAFNNFFGDDNILISAGGNIGGQRERVHFSVRIDNSERLSSYPGPQIPLGEWLHATVVVSGATATTYYDGMQVHEVTGSSVTPLIDRVNTWIGRDGFPGTEYWDGRITDFRLYQRALTPAEVMAVYAGNETYAVDVQALSGLKCSDDCAIIDDTTCTDFDYCEANPCDPNAYCTDHLPPSEIGNCTCNAGYVGDGYTCVDLDECTVPFFLDRCDSNATCENSVGSFSCECNLGYESINGGLLCVPGVDECRFGFDNCHPNAACINHLNYGPVANFSCVCGDEFMGDGLYCFGAACMEEQASRCAATAYCENDKCFCPEGSVGDGYSRQAGGSGCSRESFTVKVTLDLAANRTRRTIVTPVLAPGGIRLAYWDRDRIAFGNLFFENSTVKPFYFDSSMYHIVTDERWLTVDALFASEEEAEEGLMWFMSRVDADPVIRVFGTGAPMNLGVPLTSATLTADPKVYPFVSPTTDAELEILPTGMDVRNVYFDASCMTAGCWVVELIYTIGEDGFNVFYIPKAIGNDTLSFDFDYSAIPDYARPYGKSPQDTFLPLNFPCGSDGYQYNKPGPHIPDRVSACCLEEFAVLYRPVETFLNDSKVAPLLGDSRKEYCGASEMCAVEGGNCTCEGRAAFGAGGRWVYKESDGYFNCSEEFFGRDPAPGEAKNCSCAPRRPMFTPEYMPESALHGAFYGMEGLARVDFTGLEDPFVKQYTATVYLDEVALRQKAGVLSGVVGVAHAIDTFIGFANFKPTGLEFLDMFAAQTNIHLEKTNFFTVSAYGENDYTFLEYINLRLVAIYEEGDGYDDSLPFSFDEYHLITEFNPYPPSAAKGNATLGADSRVWITDHPSGGYTVHYHLTNLAVGETSGGIHVHTGTSCSSHELVLGHFFTTPTDPWTTVWTKEASSTVASGSVVVANPGFPLADNNGHAFVVHEQSGARIACGILYDVAEGLSRTSPHDAAHYLQVTFTLGEQYQPIETGIIPIDSVLVSKGDFITSAQTIDSRFHACKQYVDGSFPKKNLFDSRLPALPNHQLCAPNATMCYNPPIIPDQFVHFNIPLGIDWLPSASNTLDSNVFVDMVVSVIDAHQIAVPNSLPNQGGPAEQMKTTLTASIPVVEGGVYIFCDKISVKDDLLDVANADLILGSAGYEYEFSRLRILKDIASSPFKVRNDTYFKTDSIEAGLMTLVIKGNASYFVRAAGYSLELEDVITIHVMEPESGTKYRQVLELLFTPDSQVQTQNGFALNGAFIFTVDRAQARASLHPTEALNQLCPFLPTRPDPDDAFPETCVTRRDVQRRGFPALVGKNATAIELPAATVALNDPEREGVARFMQLVLNPSDYSAQLGRNFSYIVGQKYQLNGRYNRAFWINPGYEWTPQQTGGQEIFTLSQKIVMFALINLNEGFVGRRRMLLQSASPTKDTGAGVSGQQMTFDTSPQSLMASLYKLPEELVASFSVKLSLTEQQACMSEAELRRSVRATLAEHTAATATAHETVQILTMLVDRADVQCQARRRIPRGLLSFSHASVTAEMMIVFSPSDLVAIDLQRFVNIDGVQSASPILLSELVTIQSIDPDSPGDVYQPLPPGETPKDNTPSTPDVNASVDLGSPDPEESKDGGLPITMMAAIGGAAVVVLGITFLAYKEYNKNSAPREVDVVGCIDVTALKAELALPPDAMRSREWA